jgi:hypothetical protein
MPLLSVGSRFWVDTGFKSHARWAGFFNFEGGIEAD